MVPKKKRAPKGNGQNGQPKFKGSFQSTKGENFEHLRADNIEELLQQNNISRGSAVKQGNPPRAGLHKKRKRKEGPFQNISG